MRDPVVASDGHSYERNAIEEVLRPRSHPPGYHPRSPLTREALRPDLIPNHALRRRIEAHENELDRTLEEVARALRAQAAEQLAAAEAEVQMLKRRIEASCGGAAATAAAAAAGGGDGGDVGEGDAARVMGAAAAAAAAAAGGGDVGDVGEGDAGAAVGASSSAVAAGEAQGPGERRGRKRALAKAPAAAQSGCAASGAASSAPSPRKRRG